MVVSDEQIPTCMSEYAAKFNLPRNRTPQLVTTFAASNHLFTTDMLKFLVENDYVCTDISVVYQFAVAKPFAIFISGCFK